MQTIRILFVDDRSRELESFLAAISRRQVDWTTEVTSSGQSAIELLDRVAFDIVITEIDLPDCRGSDVLHHAAGAQPQAVRFVLTRDPTELDVIELLDYAHQFVDKTAAPARLVTAIRGALIFRDSISCQKLSFLLSGLRTLPSVPALYLEIVEELEQPEPSMARVAEIVSSDISMTAKLLQLVNSAFLGVKRNVSDVAQAVGLLGLETIKSLVLSVKVFSQFREREVSEFNIDSLWSHSFRVGAYARQICRSRRAPQHVVEEAYLAGLLHDVGKLILADNLKGDYSRSFQLASERDLRLDMAEQLLVGASHAEVGAYLLGLWGFPPPVVEAVGFHHEPSRVEANPSSPISPLIAVHAANAIVCEEDGGFGSTPLLDEAFFERLGLADDYAEWREACTAMAAG